MEPDSASGSSVPTESPLKRTGAPVTRHERTKRLKAEDFVVKFPTLDSFKKTFFKDSLSASELQRCRLPDDDFDRSVERIQSVDRSRGGNAVERKVYKPFCSLLDKLCDVYADKKKVRDDDRIKFVVHAHNAPRHHPDPYTDKHAEQEPDIVALKRPLAKLYSSDVTAWKPKASGLNRPAVAWHHILSFAEGKGEVDADGIYQAATYSGSLLQARPDLPGHFFLSFDVKSFQLGWSDNCGVYVTPNIYWDDEAVHDVLLHYVHFLHQPLRTDPSIVLRTVPNQFDALTVTYWEYKSYALPPIWMLYDNVGNHYVVDVLISIGEPWTRKNWVVRSTCYGPVTQEPVKDQPPVIIKDSFLHPKRLRASAEGDLLDRIHLEGLHILGVMRKVDAYVLHNGENIICTLDVGPEILRNGACIEVRHKYRLILDASVTTSLFECPTMQSYYKSVFDLLAASRHIHAKRQILHRDMSLYNAVFFGDDMAGALVCKAYYEDVELDPDQPNFIRAFMASDNSDDDGRCWPTCLLLDFDNAKLELQGGYTGVLRTARPTFVAMAVARGKSTTHTMQPDPMPVLTDNAYKSYVAIYGEEHYKTQSDAYKDLRVLRLKEPKKTIHAPRHDAESLWWATVVFALYALPKGKNPKEDKHRLSFEEVLKVLDTHEVHNVSDSRSSIRDYDAQVWASVLHEGMEPVAEFLAKMGDLFLTDYALLEPEPDPYHLHEAMQRLLLQEIWRMEDTGKPIPLDVENVRMRKSKTGDYGYSSTGPHTLAKRARDAEDRAESAKAAKQAKLEEKKAEEEQDARARGLRRSSRNKGDPA